MSLVDLGNICTPLGIAVTILRGVELSETIDSSCGKSLPSMELLGLVEDQAGVDKWVPGPARRLSVELPGHLGAWAVLEVGLGRLPCWYLLLGSHSPGEYQSQVHLGDILLLDNMFGLSEILRR